MSLGRNASKGFTSFLYRNLLEKVLGMGALVILARKLSPEDFGLVSITEVLLAVISVFGTTGISEYLLAYRGKDSEEIFRSAFWLNIFITLAIVVIFAIALPFWGQYQHDERIWKIGLMSGGIFIFSQLQLIPKAWLSKNMMFDVQAKMQAPFIIVIAVGKIIAVYLNCGVYSLLIPTLLCQPLLTYILYRSTSLKTNFNIHIHRWKEIFSFTKHLIGTSILSRITDQGDKIIIAKVLGLTQLGIYNIALQMADLLTSQLIAVSNNILSSVLPNYVDDKQRFFDRYMSFLKVFAFFLFPVLAVMALAAKPIILTLYGPKWIEAVLPMQILLVYAAFRVVTSSYGCVMNSFHLTKQSFNVVLLYTPVYLLGSYIGAGFGIAYLALSVVLVRLLFVNVNIWQIMQVLGKQVADWYLYLLPVFANAIFITALVGYVMYSVPFTNNAVLNGMLIALAFAVTYYGVYKIFYKKELHSISGFLAVTFPKSTKAFNYLFGL